MNISRRLFIELELEPELSLPVNSIPIVDTQLDCPTKKRLKDVKKPKLLWQMVLVLIYS